MFEDEEIRGRKAPHEKQYAILRIAKMKSFAQVRGMSKHNNREFDTPNADEEKTPSNIQLVGTDNIEADVKKRIQESGMDLKKIRKNAVLAVDHMLTASPEYFRPNGEKPGQYDQQRLDDWVEASMKFLKDEYGDNLVNSTLHLDESTPHIHAVMVPIHHDPSKRQPVNLRAKEWFNGSKALSAFQDRYHEATKHLELDRGTKGSKASHQSVKRYYSNLERKIPTPSIEISTPGIKDKLNPQEYAKKQVEKASKSLSEIISTLQDKLTHAEQEKAKSEAYKKTAILSQKKLARYSKEMKGLSEPEKLAAIKFGAKTLKENQESKEQRTKDKDIER